MKPGRGQVKPVRGTCTPCNKTNLPNTIITYNELSIHMTEKFKQSLNPENEAKNNRFYMTDGKFIT